MKLKVISGGQSGADVAGLRAAREHGIETGGCAAKGFKTENGVVPELGTMYNLIDEDLDYVARTKENVRNADLTLIFADKLESAGTRLTIDSCKKFKKAHKINPAAYVIEEVVTKLSRVLPEDAVFVINIAGNRESVAPGIGARTENVLSHAFHMMKFKEVKQK
jgi:RNase P protein component